MRRFFFILLTLIYIIVLTTCVWQKDDVPVESSIVFDEVWKTTGFAVTSSRDSLVHNGVLYLPESLRQGMCAIRLSDGVVLWRFSNIFNANTNPVLHEGKLYVTSRRRSGVPCTLWIINSENGVILGRLELDINSADTNLIQYEGWLALHENTLYFPISCFNDADHGPSGIYRLDLLSLPSYGEDPVPVAPDLFLPSGQFQRESVYPVFDEDRVFVYFGGLGWSGALPEGEELLGRKYYPQSAVRLYALTYDGTIIWETGFDHAGEVFAGGKRLLLSDNTLFLADSSGRAAVNKVTGDLLYEKKGVSGWQRMTLENNRIYAAFDLELRCYDLATGNVLWINRHDYTRDANPVIWKNRLYMVDSDALHVYNKNTGLLLGRERSLGIRDYRDAGYIPHVGDIMYVPKTEELVAIRLGSERYRGVK